MENPIKMDDLGTPIFGNNQILVVDNKKKMMIWEE